MKVVRLKTAPSTKELDKILKQEYADRYSFKPFGLGEKSIIVRKSPFIGVQVSRSGNEITVVRVPPSTIAYFFSLFDIYSSEGLVMGFLLRPAEKLEKEIAAFLKHKYD